MDIGAAIVKAAKPALLMAALSAACEIAVSYVAIFAIVAFLLEALLILAVAWYSARRGGTGIAPAAVIGAVLGLACALSGSISRWAMISQIPTGYAPAPAEALGMMAADASLGGVFWSAAGFVLGFSGASLARRGAR